MSSQKNNEIPSHIGFIMNGNRTWSKKNGLSVLEGYQTGADTLESLIKVCAKQGVKFVTVYAFSTENWRRPEEEKKVLFFLFKKGLLDRLKTFSELGVRIRFIGRTHDFPKDVQKLFADVEKQTEKNEAITLFAAVSYGGRAEIVDAIKQIVESGVNSEDVSEDLVSANIYESGVPDPELIVRTGGEQRLSGFMLWQSYYSELYFTSTLWPDFNDVELEKALEFYQNIKRNFGK